MLGYVKPYKPEMKIREYECYRGFYCSLCRALGKKYGLLSKLFLSFDVTFFLIFAFAVKNNGEVSFKNGRCPFNPLKKCSFLDVDNYIFDYASAFTVIMTYYKVMDNLKDESFLKRIKYFFVYPFVYFRHKKASRLFTDIEEIVFTSVSQQSKIENAECKSCDAAADESAKALSKCFSVLADTPEEKENYSRFGYCLGRTVYLCDAFDDMEKDKKTGCFNVFINNGYDKEQILASIRMSINEAVNTLDKISVTSFGPILENIIAEGIDAELQKIVLKKEGVKNGKKSI